MKLASRPTRPVKLNISSKSQARAAAPTRSQTKVRRLALRHMNEVVRFLGGEGGLAGVSSGISSSPTIVRNLVGGGVVRSLDLRLLIARAIVVETSRKPSSVTVIVDSTPTRNRTTCQGKMPRLVVERRLDKHLVRQCQPYHLCINVRNGCRNRRGRL